LQDYIEPINHKDTTQIKYIETAFVPFVPCGEKNNRKGAEDAKKETKDNLHEIN